MENIFKVKSKVSDTDQRIFIKFGAIFGWSSSVIHKQLRHSMGGR